VTELWDRVYKTIRTVPPSRNGPPGTVLGAQEIVTVVKNIPTENIPWAQVTRLGDPIASAGTVSPYTMITSYRGDVCAAKNGATLYTNDGPPSHGR
jgi:hypothetical protein